MQRAWPGALMLVVTLTIPEIGIGGLMAVTSAYGFARFIGMREAFINNGFFTYNALLVGLGLGNLFEISLLSLLLAAIAGVMSLALSIALNNVFRQYLNLPILSLPFAIVSAITYLASLGYSNLLLRQPGDWIAHWRPDWLPDLLTGFLQSLGAILFLPYPLTGLILAAALLWYSRIIFTLALAGFTFGAGLTLRAEARDSA